MGVYLGVVKLFWCLECGVPILDNKCSLCGREGIKVDISPPGDVRPAFKEEIDLLQETLKKQFGVELRYDGCIVLNKVPYLDHMDEIVVDGNIIGALRFNIFKMDWEFLPKLPGGQMIWRQRGGKWVCADKGAVESILHGSANLLGPGILDCDPEISIDDQVIIVDPDGKVFATGVAKKSGEEMLKRERGVAVKIRERGDFQEKCVVRRGTWDDAVKANEEVLNKFEEKAIRFIRNVATNYGKPVTVAFSGGKDSLVTLLLVLKALGKNFKVLFVDTGVEFPETVAYTEELIKNMELEFLEEKVNNDVFWSLVEEFGPPGRDYRICCKGCKLGPLTKMINQHFSEGCLTFIGQRSYESETRFREPKVSVNPWVPGQIAAYPIKNWTALHVWLYIFREKIQYNPLYERGFNRIGCWPCPASKLCEIETLKKTHKDLYEKLMETLEKWRRRYGYPKEWLQYGFWRWKKIPEGHLRLAAQLGVKISPERPAGGRKITYSIEKVDTEGGEVAGRFNVTVDVARLKNIANIMGTVNVENNEVVILNDEGKAKVKEDGGFVVTSHLKEKVKQGVYRLAQVLVKATRCVGCGECVPACKRKAVIIKWGMAWIIEEKCTHCSKCMNVKCTAVYANK